MSLPSNERIDHDDARIVHRCRNGNLVIRAADGLFYAFWPAADGDRYTWTYAFVSKGCAIGSARGDAPARVVEPATRTVEGVPYYRHVVRYTLSDGRRRRMVRWSPGYPWVRDEVGRELMDRFGLDGIRSGSVTIRMEEQ